MIVTCPACETRYQVADDALRSNDSRRVRCADCGNVWLYSPEGAAIQEAMAELTAATAAGRAASNQPATPRPLAPVPRAASPAQSAAPPPAPETPRTELRIEAQARPAGPTVVPRPTVQVELPAATQQRRARIRGLLLTILAVGIIAILFSAREQIMRTWPQTVPIYAALRLTDAAGAGLEVTVTPSRTADSLTINGDVVNKTSGERRIPRMRLVLQDSRKNEIDSKVIDPPVDSLPAGGSARFSAVFERPNLAATDVAVTFVTQ